MGLRRLRTGTLAGALTAPLLALSACGGGQSSVADPPVTSGTSSPTATPHESPEHFIRRWAAADIRMQNSGLTEGFRRLSRRCGDCLQLADRVDRIYRAGGYIHADGWVIGQIDVVTRSRSHLLIDLHVTSRPTAYRVSTNSPTRSYPGGPATYQLGIAKASSSWVVTSLGRVSA
jgi:hypothetical protein